MNYLENYYSNYDEEGRLLSKHGQVEYLTTMKYIHQMIDSDYKKICKKKLKDNTQDSIQMNSDYKIPQFADESFDMTLVLGQMYHMYTNVDKEKVLAEAIRVTKKGRYILVAVLMKR